MSRRELHVTIACLAVLVVASATTTPGTYERVQLDRILQAALDNPSLAPDVFDVLRLTAEGTRTG